MKKLIGAAFALALLSTTAFAEWALPEMNKQIDETNWIVEAGKDGDAVCAATTIDKERRLLLTSYHCIMGVDDRINGPNYQRGDIFVIQRQYEGYSVVKEVRYAASSIDLGIPTSSLSYMVRSLEEKYDLTVLQIRDTTVKLPSQVKIAKENPKYRGERVYIVGNASGQDGTLTVGHISNLHRTIIINGRTSETIQVSGGMSGGMSGGGAFNGEGELFGVNHAVNAHENYMGYVIPVEHIRDFLTKTVGLPKGD
jgi:hypothetical protein